MDGKLVFRVERKPYRFVEVALNALDLYDVRYFRLKRGSFERVEVGESTDVFCEDLGEAIYGLVCR